MAWTRHRRFPIVNLLSIITLVIALTALGTLLNQMQAFGAHEGHNRLWSMTTMLGLLLLFWGIQAWWKHRQYQRLLAALPQGPRIVLRGAEDKVAPVSGAIRNLGITFTLGLVFYYSFADEALPLTGPLVVLVAVAAFTTYLQVRYHVPGVWLEFHEGQLLASRLRRTYAIALESMEGVVIAPHAIDTAPPLPQRLLYGVRLEPEGIAALQAWLAHHAPTLEVRAHH